MNRRAFSRLLPALAVPVHDQAAPPVEERLRNARTFTSVGKEERPFLQHKEAELANQDGQGYLAHMWFGGSFPNFALLRIRLYVDHESAPSIDMELGIGTGFGFQDPTAPWGTRFSGKTGSPSGIFNFYRIPFSTNVRVTAELPEGTDNNQVFWWIVRGVENVGLEVFGLPLPEAARLRLHKLENYKVAPLAEFDLCKTEKTGILFQVAMAAKSESFEFMESIVRAYIGNATQPQLLSSGLEDYFLGTYYFNRGLYHLPEAGLTHKDEQNFAFSGYRFHEEDPIFSPKVYG